MLLNPEYRSLRKDGSIRSATGERKSRSSCRRVTDALDDGPQAGTSNLSSRSRTPLLDICPAVPPSADARQDSRAAEQVGFGVVEGRESFCAVKEQYLEYGEAIRDSVVYWGRRGRRFSSWKNELAVRKALGYGAWRLGDTEYVLGL